VKRSLDERENFSLTSIFSTPALRKVSLRLVGKRTEATMKEQSKKPIIRENIIAKNNIFFLFSDIS
jgi:hypothetical protein